MLPRSFYRIFWLPIYRFWALRYVRSERVWNAYGLRLHVPPGVFHPGIYFSTPIFLDFLGQKDWSGKKVVDIGTGTGALALFVAKAGANTVAVDLHPGAVQTARRNAAEMGLSLTVLESDLLRAVPQQVFDFVLVNPPYYPKNAGNDTERAFFAGASLDYFTRFFQEIETYLHPKSVIWMILSEDCDLNFITQAAHKAHFSSKIVFKKKHWGERLFVLQIFST